MPNVTSLNTASRKTDFGPGNYKSIIGTTITAATTLDVGNHEQTFVVDNATGFAITLPPATGSGTSLTFVIKTTVSSGNQTFVTSGSDVLLGWSHVAATDASGAMKGFATSSGTTITMNGTTKGGIAGDRIELRDVQSGIWSVRIFGTATGTLATPFS